MRGEGGVEGGVERVRPAHDLRLDPDHPQARVGGLAGGSRTASFSVVTTSAQPAAPAARRASSISPAVNRWWSGKARSRATSAPSASRVRRNAARPGQAGEREHAPAPRSAAEPVAHRERAVEDVHRRVA